MIAGEDDHGFVVEIGFFQDFDESCDASVHPRTGLVVLGQFFTSLRCVGQKRRDRHIGGIEKRLVDTGEGPAIRLVTE